MTDFNTEKFYKIINSYKRMAYFALTISFLSTVLFALLYWNEKSKKEQIVYVSADAGNFLVKRNELGIRQDFEIKNHVELYLQRILENDRNTYASNMDAAGNLIEDNSHNKVKSAFKKIIDFYLTDNAHSTVQFDSVKADMSSRPFKSRAWMKINVFYGGNKKSLPAAAVFEVSEHIRSEKNPAGLIINDVKFIDYSNAITSDTLSTNSNVK